MHRVYISSTEYALVLSPNLKESSAWNELYYHLFCTWYLFSFNILWNSKILHSAICCTQLPLRHAYDTQKNCAFWNMFKTLWQSWPKKCHECAVRTVTCDKIVSCESATGACSKFVQVYMYGTSNGACSELQSKHCLFWTWSMHFLNK